jgi:CheY-like chemotaxis protein
MANRTFITEPIIIVEDDVDDQFLLKRIFERIGLDSELLFFSDAKEALNYLQTTRKKTFLILCDINMPGMNGLEFRSRINNDEPLRKKCIPFVFLSTSARQEDVTIAFDMTVQGFFQKEARFEDMEEAIRCIIMYWLKSKSPGSFNVV